MDKDVNVRELIVDMYLSVLRDGEHSHILLKNVLDKYDYLDGKDKAFIKRVFEGTLERSITIDYVINKFSSTKVNKMKPLIRCLIRMSVYQILYMDRVPDSAVINEAVKIAKKRKFVNLSGFVNGVLRNISRNKEAAVDTDAWDVIYSTPEIIIDELIKDYGKDTVKGILEASLKERHFYVRVREDISADEKNSVFEEWEKEGVSYIKSDMLEYAYELKNTDNIARFEGFEKGLYTVQDITSMMVCECAKISKDDYVIDVCAAPGGKSLHAANKGAKVSARDLTEAKVELIDENIERFNIDSIESKVWDARELDEDAVEKADVLICDIPCSGLGVMGRKPDIKLNASTEGFESIENLQREIIDTVWRYVKPGKTMMYSTCTLRKSENEKQVEYILNNYPFELVDMNTYFTCDKHDGFFIAKLVRKN